MGEQERVLRGGSLALDQRERHITAKDDPALTHQPLGESVGERTDGCDRCDTECDAGDEHVEAPQPAAHFAQRKAQGQTDPRRRGGWTHRKVHRGIHAVATCSSTWPERNRITRSQRRASEASWVTSTSVMACAANLANIR